MSGATTASPLAVAFSKSALGAKVLNVMRGPTDPLFVPQDPATPTDPKDPVAGVSFGGTSAMLSGNGQSSDTGGSTTKILFGR